jgi:cobalt-zinc-cadmium efflux system outer membrane protein
LSASGIALDRARRAASARKQALAVLMGGDVGDFAVQADGLPALVQPHSLESYYARLPQTPDARSQLVNVAQAEAALSLEKANALPDPTLGFGIRQFRTDDTQAFVAGVSLPIPVFNLNRAGIKRAGYELNAVRLEQRGTALSLEAALAETYGNYVSAYEEADALKNTLLPGAEEAFAFARGGYDAGKFSYLEVLDAQRTLFDARRQLNESTLEYHRQLAILERMTAVHMHENISDKE